MHANGFEDTNQDGRPKRLNKYNLLMNTIQKSERFAEGNWKKQNIDNNDQ